MYYPICFLLFLFRNIKSILVAAGALKRQFPDTNENELAYRAINDCNLSKFTSEDIPLFKGITSVTLHTHTQKILAFIIFLH